MAEIDSLLISVTANSEKAQNALDGLASGLERMSQAIGGVNASALSQIASGITNIATAMQGISGIDKRSFTSLAGKFNELNNIDGAKLIQTAGTLEQIAQSFNSLSNVAMGSTSNIVELAKSVGAFGGKKVGVAIEQIPKLGNKLRELFVTLSTAPQVSDNVIKMTNALANLASQGQKIGTATRSINSNLKSTHKSTFVASLGFKGLASAIGKFYATYFLVMRAVKGMGKAIEKSMDYTETYNYWNVALDKVQKQYGSDYKRWTQYYSDMGMNSAESYAKSFETRLKELVRKMSGNVIGENGELLLGDKIGLGLDAEQLLNFQAKILGVTNSVGLLGETSINTAKAMSMLAGDISSLTNQSIESVMQNLQSGLIGQSRALYKYGIDITNATLQEIALAHGIEKKVSAMSQSEKMQLRVLAILQQSKVAWGDQANTINSVANQYRIFKQQISNLARTLGNLLLPIVKTVLPYINAVIIVLQKLFTVLGFKLWGGSWLKDLQDGLSGGAGDIGEEFGELGEDMEDMTEKAKKLKKQLQGFDELNVISTNDDESGSGGSGKSPFDLSFDIADALKEYEKVWNDALNKAKNKADEIAKAILNAFNKFKQSDFYKSMEKLFTTLSKLVKISFKALYDFYDKFLKPVAKWVGNKVIATLVDLFVKFVEKIKWNVLLESLRKLWEVLAKFTINIGQGFLDFMKVVLGFALDVLAVTINTIAKAFGFLFDVFLAEGDEEFLYAIGVALGVIFSAFAVSKLPNLIGEVATKISKFGTEIFNAGKKLIEFVQYNPEVIWATIIVGAVVLVIKALQDLQAQVDEFTIQAIEDALKGDTSLTDYADMVKSNMEKIGGSYTEVAERSEDLKIAKENLDIATESLGSMFAEFDKTGDIVQSMDELTQSFTNFLTESESVFKQEYALISLYMSETPEIAEESINKFNEIMDKVKENATEREGVFADAKDSFAKLNEEFEKTNDMQAYVEGLKEIATSLGYSFDFESSDVTEKLEELKGSLDFSEVVENGKISQKALDDLFAGIADTYSQESQKISDSTDVVREAWSDMLKQLGMSEEDRDYVIKNIVDPKEQESLDALAEQITEFSNTLGTELLTKVPEVIKNAESQYDKLNWAQKLLYPTEGDYIEKAIKDFEDGSITPFVESTTKFLQDTLDDKNQNADWVSSSFVDMFNAGFESASKKVVDDPYIAQTCESITLKLGENWEEEMNNVLENIIIPSMETGAHYSVDAFGNVIRHGGTSGSYADFANNINNEVDAERSSFETVGQNIANYVIEGFQGVISSFSGYFGFDFSSNFGGGLPQYATGGFPEDGVFMANHGELVGRFANGKTAVANNEQIERGIANAVYNAIVSAGGFGGNSNVTVTLEGDAKGLFRMVQENANDYTNRTGRPAFGY